MDDGGRGAGTRWTTCDSQPHHLFLEPRSRDFYVEWAAVAKDVVAALRIEGGRNPYDRGLTDLIGDLLDGH